MGSMIVYVVKSTRWRCFLRCGGWGGHSYVHRLLAPILILFSLWFSDLLYGILSWCTFVCVMEFLPTPEKERSESMRERELFGDRRMINEITYITMSISCNEITTYLVPSLHLPLTSFVHLSNRVPLRRQPCSCHECTNHEIQKPSTRGECSEPSGIT